MTLRRLWHRFLARSYAREAERLEESLGRMRRPPEVIVRATAELAEDARGKAARYRAGP